MQKWFLYLCLSVAIGAGFATVGFSIATVATCNRLQQRIEVSRHWRVQR